MAMSREDLGFTIRGGRVELGGGVSRSATPEEERLWDALGDDDGDEDSERSQSEANPPVSYARSTEEDEEAPPEPQKAIRRAARGGRGRRHSADEIDPATGVLKENLPDAPEDSDDGDDGDEDTGRDVAYASSAAQDLAEEEGLTNSDFDGIEPSGAGGDYTKADVEKAVDQKNA